MGQNCYVNYEKGNFNTDFVSDEMSFQKEYSEKNIPMCKTKKYRQALPVLSRVLMRAYTGVATDSSLEAGKVNLEVSLLWMVNSCILLLPVHLSVDFAHLTCLQHKIKLAWQL